MLRLFQSSTWSTNTCISLAEPSGSFGGGQQVMFEEKDDIFLVSQNMLVFVLKKSVFTLFSAIFERLEMAWAGQRYVHWKADDPGFRHGYQTFPGSL